MVLLAESSQVSNRLVAGIMGVIDIVMIFVAIMLGGTARQRMRETIHPLIRETAVRIARRQLRDKLLRRPYG